MSNQRQAMDCRIPAFLNTPSIRFPHELIPSSESAWPGRCLLGGAGFNQFGYRLAINPDYVRFNRQFQ
jgi:hypothetical protein